MNFETELQKGNFMIGTCTKCKKTVWPPSDFCDMCFNNLEWKKIQPVGTLIEYGKKDDDIFCVSELENGIRIMGKLKIDSGMPIIGSKIMIEKCGIINGNYSFVMRVL